MTMSDTKFIVSFTRKPPTFFYNDIRLGPYNFVNKVCYQSVSILLLYRYKQV